MIRWVWSKMLKWGWDFSYNYDSYPVDGNIKVRQQLGNATAISDYSQNSIDLTDPINFRVQSVAGGTLIETRWYDHKKDTNISKLHIVTSEENLSESIGKIVTMELLQR